MNDYPRALDLVSSGRLELWPHNAFLLPRFVLTFLTATLQHDRLGARAQATSRGRTYEQFSRGRAPIRCLLLAICLLGLMRDFVVRT